MWSEALTTSVSTSYDRFAIYAVNGGSFGILSSDMSGPLAARGAVGKTNASGLVAYPFEELLSSSSISSALNYETFLIVQTREDSCRLFSHVSSSYICLRLLTMKLMA